MRLLIASITLLAGSTHANAQDIFIAPTPRTVTMGMEANHGSDPAQILFVRNESTIPIVVKSVTLSSCQNIRQSCSASQLNILIGPGMRRTVYQVYPQQRDRAPTFQWRITWHADSTDAKAMELLRANTGQATARPDTATRPTSP